MTQDEIDRAVTIGYYFGLRLTRFAHGIEPSLDSLEMIEEHLKQVAEGSITLGPTPAEIRLKAPDLNAEKLEKYHQDSIKRNQNVAQSILATIAKRPSDGGLSKLQ